MSGTSESIDMVDGRAWRKLHLGVDETTKEIVAVEVTPNWLAVIVSVFVWHEIKELLIRCLGRWRGTEANQ